MTASIHSHRWQPSIGAPERPFGVYLLHGTGEHAARYERLASRLTTMGWQVGAHDHIGHGLSTGKRGLVHPANVLSTIAIDQIDAFNRETGKQTLLMGHSLGGVLATQLVIEYKLPVKGLMLSAPAYVPIMRPIDHLKRRLLSALAPKLCLDLGYDPRYLTHDENEQVAALEDNLIHGYKSASLVNWLLDTGARMMSKASQINVQTLLMIAGADLVADSSRTREFAGNVPPELLTLREYEGFYHELLNETPDRRARPMSDIETWLERIICD